MALEGTIHRYIRHAQRRSRARYGAHSGGCFQSAEEPVVWPWGSSLHHLNTEFFNGDGDMFGRKKKEILPLQRRCRSSIIQEALTLIAVANKAERECLQSGDPESTDAQELSRTEVVLKAQTTLTERIVLSQSSELTMREISTELIQPVLDRSVVGEVAQLALDHALRSAGNKFAPG